MDLRHCPANILRRIRVYPKSGGILVVNEASANTGKLAFPMRSIRIGSRAFHRYLANDGWPPARIIEHDKAARVPNWAGRNVIIPESHGPNAKTIPQTRDRGSSSRPGPGCVWGHCGGIRGIAKSADQDSDNSGGVRGGSRRHRAERLCQTVRPGP